MIRTKPPTVDAKRQTELLEELRRRAESWLPEWRLDRSRSDFGTTILKIAARLSSEVTQRLDKVPNKNHRAFLDWLGVRGSSTRAARMPVVFNLTQQTLDASLAPARSRLQGLTGDKPVSFETEQTISVQPGRLSAIVATDTNVDGLYFPTPSLLNQPPPQGAPSAWISKGDAPVGAMSLQLDPPLGLMPHELLLIGGKEYGIIEVKNDIVTLDRPLEASIDSIDGVPAKTKVRSVMTFEPFTSAVQSSQEHLLYLGETDLLNLDKVATIDVLGAELLPADTEWSYWGKQDSDPNLQWWPLKATPMIGGVSLAKEKKGAIETLKIGNYESRWIRASRRRLSGSSILLSRIQLRINCKSQTPQVRTSSVATLKRPSLALDGLANTTPLVLDRTFLPLGREPRLFDAFYLGSPEAFSKPNAKVTIAVDIEDATLGLLGKAQTGQQSFLVFGVGRDGLLHRIEVNPSQPDQKPLIVFKKALALGDVDETSSSTVKKDIGALKINQSGRPAICRIGARTLVGVSAQNKVWIWIEHDNSIESQWVYLGIPRTGSEAHVTNIVLLQESDDVVFVVALQDGDLFQSSLALSGAATSPWKILPRPIHSVSTNQTALVLLTSICHSTSAFSTPQAKDGYIAVDQSGTVFRYLLSQEPQALTERGAIDSTVSPAAIATDVGLFVVAKQKGASKLIALNTNGEADWADLPGIFVGGGFDFVPARSTKSTEPMVMFSLRGQHAVSRLAWWRPFENGFVVTGEALTGSEYLRDSPVLLDHDAIAPGQSSTVFWTTFDATTQQTKSIERERFADALLLPANSDVQQARHVFVQVRPDAPDSEIRRIETLLSDLVPHFLVAIPKTPFSRLLDQDEYILFAATGEGLSGTRRPKRTLELAVGDTSKNVGDRLVLEAEGDVRALTITALSEPSSPSTTKRVTLDGDLPGKTNQTITYWASSAPTTVSAQARIALNPQQSTSLMLGAKELEVFFPAAIPSRMRTIGMTSDLIVFDSRWTKPPEGDSVAYALGAPHAGLTATRHDITGNPKLSWEYWDGAAWWTLPDVEDTTSNLRVSGEISFYAPNNIKPTDVAGKTTHWIRSRLVEGDYGKETVRVRSITTKDPNDDSKEETTQVVERSNDSIRPPRIYGIDVTFEVCCPAFPAHVLTQDNGSLIAQSDANRTSSASVEAFVPLSVAEGRRSNNGAIDRALYLGFDQAIRGEPIKILAVVDEAPGLIPSAELVLETLRGTQFEETPLEDKTQGLSQSGVFTFTLDQSPTQSELFGATQYWLRLRPRLLNTKWAPKIRGLFLNAVWAEAAETQEAEIVGSSDGSPKQHFKLARPPVISKSLRLYVRELITEEEISALTLTDSAAVLNDLHGLLGPWVRWGGVIDPEDYGPFDRVYSLDHEDGTIRFGDGVHGRIPTAGSNTIVASVYRRGGGAAANLVRPWSQLNLVTPVEGVEAVANPLGAAGGSDPEDAAATLRFGPSKLRHRGRALTGSDLEQLALEYSPTVAQASFVDSHRNSRLVVVVRGDDPTPSREFRRELQRHLFDHSSPNLARSGTFEVVGPTLVPFQIEIFALSDELDNAGEVAKQIRTRIRTLFDPALGGPDGYGWQLGASPSEQDVASAIVDVPHLDSIGKVVFSPIGSVGVLSKLRRDQLAYLVPDGIQVKFVTEETL